MIFLWFTEGFAELATLNERYGPVVKLWIRSMEPLLLISDPKYVEVLLGGNSHLEKSSLYRCMVPYLGKSLVTIDGSGFSFDNNVYAQLTIFTCLIRYGSICKNRFKLSRPSFNLSNFDWTQNTEPFSQAIF